MLFVARQGKNPQTSARYRRRFTVILLDVWRYGVMVHKVMLPCHEAR